MYHFAPIDIFSDDEEFTHQEIDDELTVTISEEDLLASNHLNFEQKHAYNLILETLLLNKSAAFFIDGPAGTGKTFLYKALLAEIRSKHIIALATASSGVAASILPGGRTEHSRFKIPLNIEKNSTCNVSKQGNLAKLLRLAKLIIWDEAPMSGKHSIEAVDKMLRDINDTDLLFGGKVIVFGGDFRQGNRLQAVIFDRDIDLRDDTLHVFQSYYIGNAYVKAIDPRHKIEAHQYQWIINSRTIIENLEDDEPALKAPEYNIISFNELDAYKDTDSEIDILAVAIQMMPPREVNTIHGKTTVQDIQVIYERATQNDGLLEEIIAKNLDTSRGSTSTSAMQTITKISEITEVIESTEPMAV
ncbi:ATP-dependent DNA helicase pif1-like [Juglans regia]|uniref:ATP-dependent DNA helicase n=1 Tax=Juglans regia TaxID=51240 RepID=A0A6P9EMQ6_JUGRE|nr:ATP-dependent DNA helicase pif1-like [Juglans regia]